MHLVLGVAVHLDALRRPVLDISGTVNHCEVIAVPAGPEGVSLSDPVEVAQRLRTDIPNLESLP